MRGLQIESPFGKTGGNAAVAEAAQERLTQATGSLTWAAAEFGFASDLAEMLRKDPPGVETTAGRAMTLFGPVAGESFRQFPVVGGDRLIGDRCYSTGAGIEHVARSGGRPGRGTGLCGEEVRRGDRSRA